MLERIQNDFKFVSSLADFKTEVLNDIPRGDSEQKDVIITAKDVQIRAKSSKNDPWDIFVIYAFDKEKVIGMTEVYFPKDETVKNLGTGLTGIRKAYYNQGIASFLKAKLIKHFIDNHPNFEYIFTENSNKNKGMLKINHRIGFKEHFKWLEYEGNVENYLQY